MGCWRVINAYVYHSGDQGGPVTEIDRVDTWDHITADMLIVTQELLGDLAAVRVVVQ